MRMSPLTAPMNGTALVSQSFAPWLLSRTCS